MYYSVIYLPSWTEFMDGALADLATRGHSEQALRDAAAGIAIDASLADALRDLRRADGGGGRGGGELRRRLRKCVICSDANDFFIREILSQSQRSSRTIRTYRWSNCKL